MTAKTPKTTTSALPDLLQSGLDLQEEGLRLLFAEIRALQAMIPAGERELPNDAEREAGYDNMPV